MRRFYGTYVNLEVLIGDPAVGISFTTNLAGSTDSAVIEGHQKTGVILVTGSDVYPILNSPKSDKPTAHGQLEMSHLVVPEPLSAA